MDMKEMKSIQDYYNTNGGSIIMGVYREKRLSGSSCIAEIKAMHEGVHPAFDEAIRTIRR